MSKRRGWLTPDAVSGWRCRTLFFPDSELFDAILKGALLLLADPNNFEQHGDLTPDETAALFQTTLYHYLDEHSCHYAARLMSTEPANLLAYCRLNEKSGSTALDFSGNWRNGTVSGAAWGAEGIGDGNTAAFFDGVNDQIDVLSTSLNSAFNGQLGTLLLWAYMDNWNDGSNHWACRFRVSGSHEIKIRKYDSAGTLQYIYTANGVTKSVSRAAPTGGWHCLAMTWDLANDAMKAYFDGAQVGVTQTGLGTWSGTLIAALLGSADGYWHGNLAHAALWDKVLSDSQLEDLGKVIA